MSLQILGLRGGPERTEAACTWSAACWCQRRRMEGRSASSSSSTSSNPTAATSCRPDSLPANLGGGRYEDLVCRKEDT